MMRFIVFIIISILLISCNKPLEIEGTLNEEVSIYPDYKDVTIPDNIAPLNFKLLGNNEDAFVRFEGLDKSFDVKMQENKVVIPPKKWSNLLRDNKGMAINVIVAKKVKNRYHSYNSFTINVAKEEIDPYLVYRLIAPGYELYNEMGIYERNIESNRERPIYENSRTGINCVNCHSFKNNDPNYMSLHLRELYSGTYILRDNNIEKLKINSDIGISSLVYPSWHPSGKYIAYSNNNTQQGFHINDPNRIEVFDYSSNISVYDIKNHNVIACPMLFSDESFETFPSFSPDGQSLYFCSSKAVDMPNNYRNVHYNLCKIAFNPEDGTFGATIDTVYKCGNNKTFSFPRVSPDGNYLLFTEAEYGNFTIWHKEADLKMIDLRSGELIETESWNSDDTESYHSWSSNGRWVVFSSRRGDGLYTRPYIGYFDAEGTTHKAFLLPQKDVDYYSYLSKSYNIPEFITSPSKLNSYEMSRIAKKEQGINVTLSTP